MYDRLKSAQAQIESLTAEKKLLKQKWEDANELMGRAAKDINALSTVRQILQEEIDRLEKVERDLRAALAEKKTSTTDDEVPTEVCRRCGTTYRGPELLRTHMEAHIKTCG